MIQFEKHHSEAQLISRKKYVPETEKKSQATAAYTSSHLHSLKKFLIEHLHTLKN